MKTPREILLQRHQSAQTKLDAVRRETIAALAGSETAPTLTPAALVMKLWSELFLPCRGVWAGLAAVWLALLVFHWVGTSGAQPMTMGQSAAPRPEMLLAWREQQRILAEIFNPPAAPPSAIAPRRNPSTPHSQRHSGPKIV